MHELRLYSSIVVALLLCATAHASPNVLSCYVNADPGYNYVAPAINAALGAGKVDNPIYNDWDTANKFSFAIFADATNTVASFTSIASGLPANNAPYQVITCMTTLVGDPFLTYYGDVVATGLAYSAVQGLYVGPHTVRAIGMAVTSTNSADGHSDWGVEMGLSASYLGLDTHADSWVAPEFGGFLAAELYNHSTFNAWDARGAFRQTGSNWASGYDHTAYGYGLLNWAAATAISSTSSLYLQPPEMDITNHGYYATVQIIPFRQTRRDHEIVYSVDSSYSWPTGVNEYDSGQIAACVTASKCTLLYTTTGSDLTSTYQYVPATSGSLTFIAFTVDSSGNASRVEEFSENTQSFTLSAACTE